jgi:hypothetical protein
MIYQVKKGDTTLQIDDNILFGKQPEQFRKMYEAARIIEHKDADGNVTGTTQTDYAGFDNCYVEVYENGRVIITLKQDDDEV